jgi:chemotaxis protein MotB
LVCGSRRKAVVEVGKVLGDNPDISVLIEKATDNDDGFSSSGPIADNWDLSTKRSYFYCHYFESENADKQTNLT